jgi:hypothetical protein
VSGMDERLKALEETVRAWRQRVAATLEARRLESDMEGKVAEVILPLMDEGWGIVVDPTWKRQGTWLARLVGVGFDLAVKLDPDALSLLKREGLVERSEQRVGICVYTLTDAGRDRARGGMPF